MTGITRAIAAAAVLSALTSGVSGLSVEGGNGHINKVQPFQRAAAHHEHARNHLARRGSSKRCPAKSTSATPTSTTKKSSPTKSSSSSGGSKDSGGGSSNGGGYAGKGGKKALAWSNGMDNMLYAWVNSQVSTIYTWGPTCPDEAKGLGLTCAAMMWGNRDKDKSGFSANSGKADILMGFNEVNLDSQANLSAGEAYSLWAQYIGWQNKPKISPSVTSAPDGIDWLNSWSQICEDNGQGKLCGVEAISLHYYGKTWQDLADYVTNVREQTGYPNVWLSEFACQSFVGNDQTCDTGEVWAFMEGVVAWAEKTDWIILYSPFGMATSTGNVGSANKLMNNDGTPNSLGRAFLDG